MSKQLKSPTKILLADDSAIMHRAVGLALRNKGFELITSDNGEDALRLARQHKPAIILADLDMPGLTGIELCQAVRKDAALAATKLILLCGSFDQVDEARLDQAPADGRLWKPFESHVLLALLDTVLKGGSTGSTVAERTLAPTFAPPTALPSSVSSGDFLSDLTQETFLPSAAATSAAPQQADEATAESNIAGGDDLWGLAETTRPSLQMEPPLPEPEVSLSPDTPIEVVHTDFRLPDEAATPTLDIQNLTQMARQHLPPEGAAHDESALRQLVREEIRYALDEWLRERLQDELSRVLAELDADPS